MITTSNDSSIHLSIYVLQFVCGVISPGVNKMNIDRKAYVKELEKVVNYLNLNVRKNYIKQYDKLSRLKYDDKVKNKVTKLLVKLDANYKLLDTMRSLIELNKVL